MAALLTADHSFVAWPENMGRIGASFHALCQCGWAQAYFSGPILNTQRFSIKCQAHIIAAIALLLRSGSPSNIPRFIVSAVVDSVERVFGRWSGTYVVIEVRERMSPTCTDHDSSASIVGKVFVFWRFAALNHAAPREVFKRAFHAMRLESLFCQFSHQASATFRVTGLQELSANIQHCAAIASTRPLLAWTLSPRHNSQSIESLVSQVNGCNTTSSHAVSLLCLEAM